MANYYNSTTRAYTDDHFSQYNSTIFNGEARIPICFCIDTSSSMECLTNRPSDYERTGQSYTKDGNTVDSVRMKPGITPHTRIDEVQRVLSRMVTRMKADRRIANAAAICIVTFDLFADCIIEFTDVHRIDQRIIRQIEAGEDHTNASKGIDMALERLDRFRSMNSRAGNESYKPVLVFMSDGSVRNDPRATYARNTVRERAEAGNLNVIPIGIGREVDNSWMRQLSADARVYHMEHEDEFDKVFEIITRRIQQTLTVLSVDEEMCAASDDIPQQTDNCERSTAYGSSKTVDDLSMFVDWAADE